MNVLLQLLLFFIVSYSLLVVVFKITKRGKLRFMQLRPIPVQSGYENFDVRIFFVQIILVVTLLEFIAIIFLILNPELLEIAYMRYAFLFFQVVLFVLLYKLKDRIYV